MFNRIQIFRPSVLVCAFVLLLATPASAHHALGGTTPQSALQGFISGLAHPIIGLDHFAFVVAVGLLAAQQRQIWLPITVVLSALLGTVFHVMQIELPFVEPAIAISVLGLGAALALRKPLNLPIMLGVGAIAGTCHGYAYGESIVGTGMTPLVAYMVGFTLVQLAVALGAYRLGCANAGREKPALQMAGWAIAGMGAAFLSTQTFG